MIPTFKTVIHPAIYLLLSRAILNLELKSTLPTITPTSQPNPNYLALNLRTKKLSIKAGTIKALNI